MKVIKILRYVFIAGMLVLLLASLSSCTTNQVSSSKSSTVDTNRVEQVDFYDSKVFDSQLSEALSGEPWQVVVTPASPFSLNDIPERMDKWLYVVQDSGGSVVAQEDPAEIQRGGLGTGWNVAVVITKYVIEKRKFGKAKGYNATIHHNTNGLVYQVTFERL